MRTQPLPRFPPGRTCGRSRSHNPKSRGVRCLQERCGNRIREKNVCLRPTQPRAHHTGKVRPVVVLGIPFEDFFFVGLASVRCYSL